MNAAVASTGALERLVETVLAAPKYQTLDRALVRSVGAQELAKGRSFKEAVKATKNKLHQVAGAYQVGKMEDARWLEQVEKAVNTGESLRPLCAELMQRHSSTRERLASLDEFYATLLAGLPPIGSLLDLACGLNPVALPWMPLPPACTYHACDLYHDQAQLLNRWFALAGQPGEAFVHDLLGGAPPVEADVVLLLKTLPVLEQLEREAGRRLLESLAAPVVVVSYPVQSLGGRACGMAGNYAAQFAALAAGRGWQVDRFEFPTELVFRIRR